MAQTVVPMIHVADVRVTADWYPTIGFKVMRYNEEEGEMNWAKLCFGNSEVMLDAGGKASTEHRREADLYVTTDNVDALYQRLKDRAQVVQEFYDAFYGAREFVILDCNGFWITFGQAIQAQLPRKRAQQCCAPINDRRKEGQKEKSKEPV